MTTGLLKLLSLAAILSRTSFAGGLETMMTQGCGTKILISAKPSQSERVAEADRAESRLVVGLTYCGLNLKTDELLEIVPS